MSKVKSINWFYLVLFVGFVYYITNRFDRSSDDDYTEEWDEVKVEEDKTEKKPGRSNPYAELDSLAFKTPIEHTKSLDSLVNYFMQLAKNDYERARLAFAWVSRNVYPYSYSDSTHTNLFSDADSVLKSRVAPGDGYTRIYDALVKKMGLESLIIPGYAKGYAHTRGDEFKSVSHSWNAVKISNLWRLVDVKWGAGYASTKDGYKYVQHYNSFWFDVDPEVFLFTHLPEEKRHQFVSEPITVEQFRFLLQPNQGLFDLGISATEVLDKSLENTLFEVVEAWTPEVDMVVEEANLGKYLNSNGVYSFKIRCKERVDFAAINNEDWTYFEEDGDLHYLEIQPDKGELTIYYNIIGYQDNYWSILGYKVR